MTLASLCPRLFVLVLFHVWTVLCILHPSVKSNGARRCQVYFPLRWGLALTTLSTSAGIRSVERPSLPWVAGLLFSPGSGPRSHRFEVADLANKLGGKSI
jgi:hypothetical protein